MNIDLAYCDRINRPRGGGPQESGRSECGNHHQNHYDYRSRWWCLSSVLPLLGQFLKRVFLRQQESTSRTVAEIGPNSLPAPWALDSLFHSEQSLKVSPATRAHGLVCTYSLTALWTEGHSTGFEGDAIKILTSIPMGKGHKREMGSMLLHVR